jgi:hypothetical protein
MGWPGRYAGENTDDGAHSSRSSLAPAKGFVDKDSVRALRVLGDRGGGI